MLSRVSQAAVVSDRLHLVEFLLSRKVKTTDEVHAYHG